MDAEGILSGGGDVWSFIMIAGIGFLIALAIAAFRRGRAMLPTVTEGAMIGLIFVTAIVAFICIDNIEKKILEGVVFPPDIVPPIPQEVVLSSFPDWAHRLLAAATIGALLWFAIAKAWIPESPRGLRGWGPWLMILVAVGLVYVASLIEAPKGASGMGWWHGLNFLNGIGVYWFATALFSPSATKFAVPGSLIRRW